MNKSITRLCILLIFILLTGGTVVRGEGTASSEMAVTSPPSAGTDIRNPGTGSIDVKFKVAPRQENGRLFFDVETNLPDGMRFMAAVRDENGVICRSPCTMGRSDIDIKNGKMAVGPFPFDDQVFPSGEYKFSLNSYPSEKQPPAVIAVIGENGANLTGPDVVEGTVVFIKEFMITGHN